MLEGATKKCNQKETKNGLLDIDEHNAGSQAPFDGHITGVNVRLVRTQRRCGSVALVGFIILLSNRP